MGQQELESMNFEPDDIVGDSTWAVERGCPEMVPSPSPDSAVETDQKDSLPSSPSVS